MRKGEVFVTDPDDYEQVRRRVDWALNYQGDKEEMERVRQEFALLDEAMVAAGLPFRYSLHFHRFDRYSLTLSGEYNGTDRDAEPTIDVIRALLEFVKHWSNTPKNS